MRRTPGAPVWQRNYYEHVIRNESALDRIRQYIAHNPAGWSEDPENPAIRDVQEQFGIGATGRSPALVYNSITVDLEFYPGPLHTLGEIRDDIIALEKEPEGLLDEILRA